MYLVLHCTFFYSLQVFCFVFIGSQFCINFYIQKFQWLCLIILILLQPVNAFFFKYNQLMHFISILDAEVLSPSLYEKIDRLLEAKVSQLASDIGEQTNKKSSSGTSSDSGSSAFRYVYHNHMNLATKTTLHGTSQSLPVEVMRTIGDMYTDMRK